MRTLTMARILLAIGWAAFAMLIATLGYRFDLVPGHEVRAEHIVLSFVAVLLAVLAHTWVAVFLVACDAVVRRTVREHALDPLLAESGRRLRWWAAAWSTTAAVLLAALFLLRSGLGPIEIPAPWHWPAAAFAVSVQILALLVSGRAVRRNEGVLDDIATRLSGRSA